MRYIMAFFKIIILGVLITVSVFQTGKLWFEDSSDRNFFYGDWTRVGNVTTDVISGGNFIIPTQVGIYINGSDIEYTVLDSGDASYESVLMSTSEIIGNTLNKGTEIVQSEGYEDLWTSPHIMLVLPFDYSGQAIASGFGIEESGFSDFGGIGTIYIVPAETSQRSVVVYLEETENKQLHEFKLSVDEVSISNEVLNHYLMDTIANENAPAYISTSKNSLPYYNRTILLPLATGDIRYHSSLYWEIPYVTDGVIDEDGVRSLSRTLFDNPDVLSVIDINDGIGLVAGSVSVRYNSQGVFEYKMISQEDGEATDLAEAVALSRQFLSLLENNTTMEYFIQDYEEVDDGIKIAYSLGYNGFPVIMRASDKVLYGMDYAIEVTVQGQEVVGLRYLFRSIPERMPQFDVFNMRYDLALDQLIANDRVAIDTIDEMYLGYRWAEDGESMSMHWVIESDKKTYFVEVEGE